MGAAQQPVEIILLRQWASYLTVPAFIVDADGLLLFYNETAGAILGKPFEAVPEIRVSDMAGLFSMTNEDGSRLLAGSHPLGLALAQRRPAHQRLRIRGFDGAWRFIESTAFPISVQGGRHLGAVAMFWEIPE